MIELMFQMGGFLFPHLMLLQLSNDFLQRADNLLFIAGLQQIMLDPVFHGFLRVLKLSKPGQDDKLNRRTHG